MKTSLTIMDFVVLAVIISILMMLFHFIFKYKAEIRNDNGTEVMQLTPVIGNVGDEVPAPKTT